MIEHKNIHEALLAVMQDIGYVQKDGHMKHGDYKYASESAFIQAVRPKLIEHGIIVYPAGSSSYNFARDTYETKSGGSMNMTLIRQGYKFVHVPSSTEIYVQTFGMGADAGDKASGKAMTNALKYALRQTLLIETGDDPDYTSSAEQERITSLDVQIAQLDEESFPDEQMTQDEKQRWLSIVKEQLTKGNSMIASVEVADKRFEAYKKRNGNG